MPDTEALLQDWKAKTDAATYGAGDLLEIADIARDLLAAVEAIRALHRPAHAVFNWQAGLRYEEPCPTCHGKAGVHECGCWADEDMQFVCRECDQPGMSGVVTHTLWPCPTIRALDAALSGSEPDERNER